MKAKFKPVPPPEVEVEDEPLPVSPTFLSDEPEPGSEAEPKESYGGRIDWLGVTPRSNAYMLRITRNYDLALVSVTPRYYS